MNKKEINEDVKEATYVASKVGIRILIGVIALVAIVGVVGIGYTLTIGKGQKNAEREVFKESYAYTEQAASFIAKSYDEYNNAESEEDKKAIKEYVVMKYPNLDSDAISNDVLKEFYLSCFN